MAAKSEKGGPGAKKGEYTLNFTELQPTAVEIAEHAVTTVLGGEVRTNHRRRRRRRRRRRCLLLPPKATIRQDICRCIDAAIDCSCATRTFLFL